MNYATHDGIVNIAICTIFLVLATISILLRLVLRVAVLRSYGWDDVLVSMALFLSIALVALIAKEVKQGQGLHDDQLSMKDKYALRHTIYYTVPIYLAAITLTKLSILVLYLRCFTDRRTRGLTYGLIAIVASFGIFSIFETTFICLPVSAWWDEAIKGHCLDRSLVWVINGGLVLGIDLAILIIPMPALNSLKLPRRKRFGLMSVFALGSLACVVSAVRLRQVCIEASTDDLAKDDGPTALLSTIELNVGIICASLPTLPSLVAQSLRAIGYRSRSPRPQHDMGKDVELAGTTSNKPTQPSQLSTSNAFTEISTEISSVGRYVPAVDNVGGILRSVTVTTSDEFHGTLPPSTSRMINEF